MEKKIKSRIQHKIDTYANWALAENFFPLKGELIIYTTDKNDNEKINFKVGNGDNKTNVDKLPFIFTDGGISNLPLNLSTDDVIHTSTSQTTAYILNNFILDIDYDSELAFDTSEIVFDGGISALNELGKSMLGYFTLN